MSWGVAFPSDQVLLLSAIGPMSDDLFNFPFWFAIDKVCWGCCNTSWASLLCSLICSSRDANPGIVVICVGWCTCGVYPRMRLYGVFFMVLEGHEFRTYCANGSQSAHEC